MGPTNGMLGCCCGFTGKYTVYIGSAIQRWGVVLKRERSCGSLLGRCDRYLMELSQWAVATFT